MYSTKTIEKILLDNTINKTPIQAAALSSETENQYQIVNNSDEFTEILDRPEYSQALKAFREGRVIYRGDRRHEDILAAVVTPGIRISQNTSNIYTRLVSDVFISWQDFPKRNRSTICTTNIKKAKRYSYDTPFIIFPQNDTKIAICSKSDFWISFPFMEEITYIDQLDEFNLSVINACKNIFAGHQSISNILKTINTTFTTGSTNDIKKLFYSLEQICIENMKNHEISDKFVDIIDGNRILSHWYWDYYTENATSLLDFIEYIMLPKKNKFRMISVDKIPKKANKEVWFEGQYLMIREDVANEIFF